MEGWTSIKGRVWPGKTVSLHLSEEKFLKSGGYYQKCKLGELFTIKGNPQLDKECFTFSEQSSYPYFTRTVLNNGIYGYVDYYDDKHLVKGNSIAVGMMRMQFFYMAHDFYAGQFTKTVFPKFEGLNWRVALWFISWFNKSSKWYLGLLVRDFEKAFTETEISVPRNIDGSLAIAFMESRIREMEESRIREMEAYLKAAGFEDCELTEEEENALKKIGFVKTNEFAIGDLYDKVKLENKTFDKRKDSRQIPDTQYSLPLVNAKHGDNGIMYYGDPNIFDSIEMTIDIVQNGAIATGDVYPQPQRTGILWDAYLIQASNHQDNAETLLYFSTAIAKSIKKKYTYDNKAYWEQVKEDKINLPITPSGEIDYMFMETYIRAQEKLAIQRVKDWRDKEIATTKNITNRDSKIVPLTPTYTNTHTDDVDFAPMMVAEDIFIPGSIEVRLRDTKREDLLAGTLDLVLMYAIGPAARKKTESSGKIALGIKEDNLSPEAVKAYESVKYIMFHYWKNSEAKPFELIKSIRLVSKSEIPDGYLLRQEKDANQYLLIEYDNRHPVNIGELDILKTQRKGSDRYIPFVCKVENIKVDNND